MYNDVQLQRSDELVRNHAPLVKRIAHHLLARLPASVQVDDLIQAGMIGLLEASRKYEASKGASFETYAGIRIRGAMMDEIRKGDWVPRSVHRNARRIAEAIKIIEDRVNRLQLLNSNNPIAENKAFDLREYLIEDYKACVYIIITYLPSLRCTRTLTFTSYNIRCRHCACIFPLISGW